MNSTEINEVIENLCRKFGIVKEELFPEIARMCIGRSAVNTVMCLIVLIILILVVKRGVSAQYDKSKSFDEQENWAFAAFLGGLIALGFLVGFWCNLYELIQWIVAPTPKTIEYILILL